MKQGIHQPDSEDAFRSSVREESQRYHSQSPSQLAEAANARQLERVYAAAAQPGSRPTELLRLLLGVRTTQHTEVPPTLPVVDAQQQHLGVNAQHSSERNRDETLPGRQLSDISQPAALSTLQHAPLSREDGSDRARPDTRNDGPATLEKLARNRSAHKRYRDRLKV